MDKVMRYSCLIFGTGLLLFLWAYFYVEEDTPENSSKVASFNIPGPHNRQLILYGSNYAEIRRSYYYSLSENGNNIFYKRSFYLLDLIDDGDSFSLLSTDDGNMIALTCIESPGALLVIHDFTTGEAFPCMHDGSLTYQEIHRLDKLLYQKFCKAIGDDKYVLSSEYTGREHLGAEEHVATENSSD